MYKASVFLSADDLSRLKRLALREGLSQAEIIRRALWAYRPEQSGDRNFSLVRSGEGPGGSVADQSEEKLLEGFADLRDQDQSRSSSARARRSATS